MKSFKVPEINFEEGKVTSKEFKTEEEAQDFLEKCKSADFSIIDLITKPAKKITLTSFYYLDTATRGCTKIGIPSFYDHASRSKII